MYDAESQVVTYPLSAMQESILFRCIGADRCPMYVHQIVCKLSHSVDHCLLERSWREVISRHDVLRTSFEWQKVPEPFQVVHQSISFSIALTDWRAETPERQSALLNSFLISDRQHGFNFGYPPIMRAYLFQLATNEYYLVWTVHSIIVDGISVINILKELFLLHDSYHTGVEVRLPRTRPFKDYISWINSVDLEPAKQYWQKVLESYTHTSTFLNCDSGSNRGFRERTIFVQNTKTLELERVAREHNLTLNTLIQGAWGILLAQLTGRTDVMFGNVRACRHAPLEGVKTMAGVLINTVPVRININPEVGYIDFLKQLRLQQVEVRPYEHVPFKYVRKWSRVPPGLLLFDSVVIFDEFEPNYILRSENASWLNRELEDIGHPYLPLSLRAYGKPALRLTVRCENSMYEEATIQLIGQALQCLLEAVINSTKLPVRDLPNVLAGTKNPWALGHSE